MDVRYLPAPEHIRTMTTCELRERFLIQNLFVPGQIKLIYSHADRMIIGGIVPTDGSLPLEAGKELASEYFAQRRELGVFNVGGAGTVTVDSTDYPTASREMVYIGRGSHEIAFSSVEASRPARFFVVSLPAQTAYPTRHISLSEANAVKLGDPTTSNKRTIYQFVHEGGVQSCQLVMGFTALEDANIWNTMPPHTHDRRCEVYLYFDLPGDNVVFHFMGQPDETRHLVMREGEAVISPSWSIHAGAGTQSYSFVWAMGGENQAFSDMDAIPLNDLM